MYKTGQDFIYYFGIVFFFHRNSNVQDNFFLARNFVTEFSESGPRV